MPTLCLEETQKRNDTIYPELFLMVRGIHLNKIACVMASQKQEELSVNN